MFAQKAACLLLLAVPLALAAEGPPAEIVYDEDAGWARLEIPAPAGRLAWTDVLAGLARAKGFDDTALSDAVPASWRERTLDLKSAWTRTALVGLNLGFKGGLRFTMGREPGTDDWVLLVDIDRKLLLATERKMKRALRNAFLRLVPGGEKRRRTFGLELDEGWTGAPPERPLVVVVPGLDSTPEEAEPILDMIRGEGCPCGILLFPNDQPVADSARLLSRELRKVSEAQPARRVAIVAASMGGLVARATVEDPDLDPGNVDRLILVAVPNHGSNLAPFAFALEVAEHVVETRDRSVAQRLYESVEDGLGEAQDDLTPGSEFLERLNARPRNPAVTYSLFLGSGALLNDAALDALRDYMHRAGSRNRFVRFLGPRVDEVLSDMDEVKSGKGDGAVSVERGRLEGVDDVVVLPFRHGFLGRAPETDAERKLCDEVLERLEAPAGR
jgi:pimeloyl-ACP methyl ester carboxylesterase